MRRALIVLTVAIGLVPVTSGPAWAGHRFRGVSTTTESSTVIPPAPSSPDAGTRKRYTLRGSFSTSDSVGQHGASKCKGKKIKLEFLVNYQTTYQEGRAPVIGATSTEDTAANNAQATFTVDVTLPSTKVPQQYTIRAVCDGQRLQKLVNNHPVNVGRQETLAYTGTSVAPLLALGVALLLAGAVLLVSTRRVPPAAPARQR